MPSRYNSRCGVIVSSSTTTACLRACNGGGDGAKNSRCGAINDGVDSTVAATTTTTGLRAPMMIFWTAVIVLTVVVEMDVLLGVPVIMLALVSAIVQYDPKSLFS